MKFLILLLAFMSFSPSLAEDSAQGRKQYKVRIAKCIKGTNFKDYSFEGVSQTLRALNCVIDTNSFLKSFIASEGHSSCKNTLKNLAEFSNIKPGEKLPYNVMKRTVEDLKTTECDLKDEYAKKIKTVAVTYFEEVDARAKIVRVTDEEKELINAFEPVGRFNLYSAKAEDYLLKYMQKNISFKKDEEEKDSDQAINDKLCFYQEKVKKKERILGLKKFLIELLGPSESKEENILKYGKKGLEFKFNGDLLDGDFFLPDDILLSCYQQILRGKVEKPEYLNDTLECFKTNANLSLCDKKYCEKVLGHKVSSSTLCQEFFDKVFLNRRETFGNDFQVMANKAEPIISKCLIVNTMILYCDAFLNSYTEDQVNTRIEEINQGYVLVGLENKISKPLCRIFLDNNAILVKKLEEQRECARAGYKQAASNLIR